MTACGFSSMMGWAAKLSESPASFNTAFVTCQSAISVFFVEIEGAKVPRTKKPPLG
jgi:hypothetical protein